ncbi:CALS12 [Symbiodinium natans]|uniref:CALS12 protein n=1 Tax=Symbiodinium natans TaxID=878477 RepID=A0A812PL31_9DINO|nr:CALS12 [Symbiodinium natans]
MAVCTICTAPNLSAATAVSKPPLLGPSVISAPGESFEAVMMLELRAFTTDPRRKMEEAVTITVKCRSQHCEVVQQLVKNAWGVQLRVLENQVLAEERCLALRWDQWQEDTFVIAVTNVWRRALENYHLWIGQPRDCVKETLKMFQETLLFYTMQAVSEQVMHCPEVMNTLFHLLLNDETSNILRFDLMCKIIDEYIHNSDPFYVRGLTLDDLNDSVPRRLGNTDMESLERRLKNCTYKGGLISKMYPARGIFAGLKLALDFRPAVELKSMVAVLAYATFSEDLATRPFWILERWAFLHSSTLAVVELATLWNLGYIHRSAPRRDQMAKRFLGFLVCTGIAVVHIVMPGSDVVKQLVGPGFLGFRAAYLTLLRNCLPLPCFRSLSPFPQSEKDPKPKFDSEGATAAFWKRLLYWTVVMLFCFLGEVYVVFPVMQGLSFESLCASRCHPLPWQSECVACNGSMFILYFMLSSMLAIDIFMGHVLFTSVIGIVLGTQRGLNGMRKAGDSAVFLSDSDLGVGENNPRAGKLMQRVFGNGWRHTWNLICYRLWKEDLLSSSESDQLMQMATKSNSDKNPDAPVYLHTLHPVVRERFTFFFASLRTICEDRMRMEENPPISHHGIFRTHDIMPLSQVLPAVNEEVILQDGMLSGNNGENLRWIIGKYPKEWQRLTARLAESNLLLRYLGKAQPPISDKTRLEVRLWASMRSQTVMRTVQGAVNYHIALETNPTIVSPHSTISKRQQLEKYVELIWSHQTHGEDNKKDSDVRRLLGLYEDYPIYLVFDLDMVHLTTLDRKIMGQMVRFQKLLGNYVFRTGTTRRGGGWGYLFCMEAGENPDWFRLVRVGDPSHESGELQPADMGTKPEMQVLDEWLDDTHFFDHFPYMSCKAMYRKRPLLEERRKLIRELELSNLDGKFIASQGRDEIWFWTAKWGTEVEHVLALMSRYLVESFDPTSVLNLEMVEVMPRRLPLMIGKNKGNLTQGKAGNQLMALRFCKGFALQEWKVHLIRLIGFREHIFTVAHGICGAGGLGEHGLRGASCPRQIPAMAHIGTLKKVMDGCGFIENSDGSGDVFVHFSQLAHGSSDDLIVGTVMTFDIQEDARSGESKATNVTLHGGYGYAGDSAIGYGKGRGRGRGRGHGGYGKGGGKGRPVPVQTWLGVRMHYGHPDFVDLYWARNRGSMSKATPHINLSEDIYLGFNVKNRGEKSDHFDFLEWEKGREVSFNAASTFLYKISGGNIGVWRSKDITESAMVLPTIDLFSFYFATVGYFVSLTIIDMTMYFYVGFHLMLTMASVSLHALKDELCDLTLRLAKERGLDAADARFSTAVSGLEAADPGFGAALHQAMSLTPAIADLWRSRELIEAVHNLTGWRSVAAHPIFNIRPKSPSARELNYGLHQDPAFWGEAAAGIDVVAAWLPLVHVSRENGTLQLICGSHKRPGLYRHFLSPDGAMAPFLPEESLPSGERILAELSPGDAVFFSQRTVHGGCGPNLSSAVRWAVDLRWQNPADRNFLTGQRDAVKLWDTECGLQEVDVEKWAAAWKEQEQLRKAGRHWEAAWPRYRPPPGPED